MQPLRKRKPSDWPESVSVCAFPLSPNIEYKSQIHKNMKKILMLLLLAAPLSLMAQKFARFDYQSVVQAMPAFKTAQAELESIAKNYQNDFADMQKEYQTKVEKYKAEVNEKTPENIRTRRQQEIMDMEQKLQQAYEDNTKALQQEEQNKMQPIILKVQEAVNAVAKEGNYVYVIDKSAAQAAGIFLNETLTDDVTSQVLAKLGVSASAGK